MFSRLRIFLFLCGCVAATQCVAQTTRPTGAFENEAIRRTATPTGTTTRAAAPSAGAPGFLDTQRLVVALAVVLGLIFLLRWIMKRFFPAVSGGGPQGAVRVLARSPLTPRQHVLLVQVGRRVLVVADNGTQMSPLSEISDPDEVAQLVGQLSGAERRAEFESAIGRAEREYAATIDSGGQAADNDSSRAALVSTQVEVQGLMTKVRELATQFGRSTNRT